MDDSIALSSDLFYFCLSNVFPITVGHDGAQGQFTFSDCTVDVEGLDAT